MEELALAVTPVAVDCELPLEYTIPPLWELEAAPGLTKAGVCLTMTGLLMSVALALVPTGPVLLCWNEELP